MLLLEFKPEGSIFNPVDSVNNSNTDQQIEIIYVMDNVTKESKKVRILRDPTKYLNPILNNLTDKDIYSEKKDSNGIPLLNRIEKYPDLPEDIFIPVEYIIQKEHEVNLNTLYVNKKGEYINSKTNNYLTLSIDNNFYKNINTTINNLSVNIRSHIPESFTFLFIPKEKTNIYCFVNHKDHIRDNNNLSNLEFVTPATNANKEDGYCSLTSENKLMEYIAYDENGKEIFRINRYNTCGYNINSITQAIRIKNGIFKNYIWKKATLSKKEITLNKLGYTWNPSDYLWYSHWKYSLRLLL